MSMPRNPALVVLISATVLVVAIAIAVAATRHHGTRAASPPPHGFAYVPPRIPAGVKPRQAAADLERRVLRILGTGSRIASVVLVAHRQDVARYLPSLPSGPALVGGPAWIVRANGLFEPVSVPPGGHKLTKPRKGWFVFDDKTGVSIAYGF